MKTAHSLGGLLVGLLVVWGCSSSRSASAINDTYLTAKQRASLGQQKAKASSSEDIDAREDNFEQTDRTRRSSGDEDYCYSCRVRRYSTGVWYDPWMDPWCGWGRSAWIGPGWGAWGPGWYSPGWTFSWGYGWGYPRTWYTPGWGWPYYYAGPGWYDPYWGYWGSYWAPVGGGSTSTSRPRTYMPRTYTAPSGGTTYTPPRGGVISPSPTPPRRTAAPSRPSGGSSFGGQRYTSPSGGGRPSLSGGSTGGGGIRSSGGGGARPR
ncbi:MAG: hypothetical protein KatS3mg026_0502 [Bacteroidia bacterium]|nr:MAG: hypothetical protein KatS3mg026_0502 [Bacteroidia bacterium]